MLNRLKHILKVGNVRPVVLIVDDHQDTRDMIALNLSLRCCAIKVAETRTHAMHMLERAEEISAILVDYYMPGTPLEEFLTLARERWPQARVALMSSDPTIEAVAHKAGTRFLQKPFNLNELEAVLPLCGDPTVANP
jgi:DNA-binding NtrC family response regulator